MSMDFAANIAELIASLEQLSKLTEEIYVGMGTRYPPLLDSLKRAITQSDKIFHAQASDNKQTVMSSFEGMYHFVQEGTAILHRMSEEDESLHLKLKERLQDIQALENHIQQIKEDSGSMELISLNAMTVALKAGNNGRAFSIITEELKRLSGRTMELTDRLTERGRKVTANFQVFQNELSRLQNWEIKIVDSIQVDFQGLVKQVETSIMNLEKRMSGTGQIGSAVSKKLGGIIEVVQSQDIIRQSIDHVIMSLRELETTGQEHLSTEDLLDLLSFHEQLPELCINVLDDIRKINEDSRKKFENGLVQTKQEVDALVVSQKRIREAADDSKDESSIRGSFIRSQGMFYNLAKELSELLRAKSFSVTASQDLEKQVRELDDDFRSFESIITRFQTVDVASRIEIAKQQVLREMTNTVDEMTDLTSHIKSDVESAIGITGSFLKDTHKYLSTYRRYNTVVNSTVQDFLRGIEKRGKSFQDVQDSLFESFNSSDGSIMRFVQEFSRTEHEISSLSDLSRQIDQLSDRLRDLKAGISARKGEVLRANGIPTWRIHNHKLNEMIDRFTIFTHKQAAAQIGGFEVEVGRASGEVTLF